MNNRLDTVFFDFDGTLVDNRRRMYTLFCELTKSNLPYEEYWKLKRNGYNQADMLKMVGYKALSSFEFKNVWLLNIEREDLLQCDSVFDDVIPALSMLKNNNIKLYVVTNRQSYNQLIRQMKSLGIHDYFDLIMSTFQKCSKAEKIASMDVSCLNSCVVGDSMEDLVAAKTLGVIGYYLNRDGIIENNVEIPYQINDLNQFCKMIYSF